jgi:YVTN family beta-propeller protein
MIALYHTGRHAEALNTYREARRFLVAELGLEPSPELRQLERAILAQDLHGGPARADGLPRNGRFHATEDEAGAPRRTLVAPLEYLWRHRFGRIVGAMVVVAAVAVGVLIVAIGSRSNRRRTVPPSAIGLIDPQRNEVVATAPFPAVPGTLATGVGSIWVGSLTDQTITIVNPRTREVEHTVSFNSYPSSFAAGAGALWVFEDSLQPGEAAAITRVASDGTVTRDEIPKSAKFHNPYHNPNTCGLTGTGQQRSKITVGGGRVWFVCVDGTLGSFDPQSNRMHVGTYEGRGSPTGIAFNSDGVWVTDAEHNLLLQIDPASHATVREFSVGAEPRGIIATRGSVWVAGFAADNVTRVELPGGGLAADQTAIRVGRGPTSIAYGQGAVWVANADRTISRIDPQSNRVTATIPIGNVPNGIAADEHGVWVTTGQ